MKALPLLATMALLTLSLNGCSPVANGVRMREPMHLTLRVVGDNGEPLANTSVKIHQIVLGADRFFCMGSIGVPGYGGGGCGGGQIRVPVYKGEFPASGSLDFTLEYGGKLYIEVAESCDNTAPNAMRRYFRREMATWLVKDGETITAAPLVVEEGFSYYTRYEPCTTRKPSLENWDDHYYSALKRRS
ncbi:hypothetical protein [Pseudomonas quasicaspiana]|uniref:hypothetical protein n=1 Tax=Pseudomonas quasicaspiana TaxID=2829821 RepID=UPI000EFFE121|nr:hypothetical protein [Pseudomonas quasicaspiana]MCD5972043.1 hypothetical protein [Pseudomonas quasicaspiana]MCD5978173.1 hypothetical protein [Pseudomonas quasicaspiana]